MDASDDYYLLNINGYGAFSSEYFECYLQNDAKTLETLQSDCFPVSRAGFYADIINGPAMFLTYSITFGDQLDNRFVDLFIAADTKQKKINYLRYSLTAL